MHQNEETSKHTSDSELPDRNPATLDQAAIIDQLKRALANVDNTRKRLQRSSDDDKRFAIANFALRLLPPLAVMNKTMQATPGSSSVSGLPSVC